MAYTPQPGALTERVCTFFFRNREETLTVNDIVRKFDLVDAINVHGKLESAVNGKFLNRAGSSYSAGPSLAAWTPTNGLPAKSPAQDANPTGPRRLPRIDPDTIVIETGITKPPIRDVGYRSVIERMTPGTSVKLPHATAKRFLDWAKKLAKASESQQRWSLRKVNDTETRVWRDA